MDLYLLRHGIAVKRQTSLPRRDAVRPLTKEGVRKMRRVARGMRALGITADLIMSSPLLRAKQTAEIVAAELGCPPVELAPDLEPGGKLEDLCSRIRERAHEGRCIILVGHEPALSTLVSVLLTGGERLQMTIKKGGLCKLRVDRVQYGSCATLQWLLSPRLLAGLR